MADSAAPEWGYRYFDTYDLRQEDLQDFLKGIFGNFDFYINVQAGKYRFWIQRDLTQAETKRLAAKRLKDYD